MTNFLAVFLISTDDVKPILIMYLSNFVENGHFVLSENFPYLGYFVLRENVPYNKMSQVTFQTSTVSIIKALR